MDFLVQSQRKYVAFHDDVLYRMMITAADDFVRVFRGAGETRHTLSLNLLFIFFSASHPTGGSGGSVSRGAATVVSVARRAGENRRTLSLNFLFDYLKSILFLS